MGGAARISILTAALLGLSSIGSAYYHWTYFSNRTGPFQPVTAKFDLNTLPSKTLSYFISEQGPGPLMPGDSVTAVLSQIRLAADVWDGSVLQTCDLSLAGTVLQPRNLRPAWMWCLATICLLAFWL